MIIKSFLSMCLTGMLATVPALEAQNAPFMIGDGTPIKLRLNRNLSSADARVGETVDFEVLDEVVINGIIVLSRGSAALATVTEAKAKGRMGKSGRLNVNIDHARLASGEKIALRAVKETAGGSNTGKMTGAIVATSIVFFPAAPLFLFMKGKDTVVPKGTEITAYVNGDVRLDPARFAAAPAPAHTSAPALMPVQAVPPTPLQTVAAVSPAAAMMTNEDVIQLKLAGFTDDLILSKVRTSPAAFRTDTADLVKLKRAGISQAVIAAMLERSARI